MIDSPPAHPDTVITTRANIEKALNSFGMQYTHITVDLQLYHIACLVQWNDSLRWANVILHPGMMHTLMSFLGCIETLMRASGVDILTSAAFACFTSIVKNNGKAWTNGLWAYRVITAVLLYKLYLNGAKTYGHHNYAQYLNWYMRQMGHLPQRAKEDLTGRRSRWSWRSTVTP